RRLGRPNCVVPVSPLNWLSESKLSHQKVIVESRPSINLVRAPISAPRDFTNKGFFAVSVPSTGLRLLTVPRASVEWKPSPKFKKSSVFSQGPSMTLALGLSMAADFEPEFQGPV